jgi:tetratricopeptide (TPR) repeat protein
LISLKQWQLGLGYYTQAIRIFLRLRKYLKRSFIQDLQFPNQLEKHYFYHSKYYNRTKQYMHANHFFGELLCVLRSYQLTENEYKSFANLSACAPLFDDFFDKGQEDLSKIQRLLNDAEGEKAETEEQKLAVHFLKNILSNLEQKEDFLRAANHLFKAQEEAKKNQSIDSKPRTLWKYSQEKGGYSGLMYALLLKHTLSEEEKNLAFKLGAFGQFMDDVFDLYDDRKAGVFTLPNTAQSVSDIETFFEELLQSIKDTLAKMTFAEGAKNDFVNILEIFASAIRLALQHYSILEDKNQTSPSECLKLERKKWIVDMEKASNAFKMFRIGLKHLK